MLKFKRRSIRLKGYDYSQAGRYFVTICTYKSRCIFGKVKDKRICLNRAGVIIERCWNDLETRYNGEIHIDEFIVMPNHVHGIIFIPDLGRAGFKPAPTRKHPLSEIVRAFKTFSSRRINELRNSPGTPVWQRNYYEHVIRNESDYRQIGEYILYNPAKWEMDRENPNAKLNIRHLSFEY